MTLNIFVIGNISWILGSFPPKEPPLLGEDFAASSKGLFDRIGKFRSQAVKYLMALPLEVLTTGFSDRGKPLTPEQQAWQDHQRVEFGKTFGNLGLWHSAMVQQDRTFAKYDYWSKAAYFSTEEVLWLSVGLQPLSEFTDAVDLSNHRTSQVDVVAEHMRGQRELLRRSFGFDTELRPQTVLTWANSVGYELHPGFRRMIEATINRNATVDAVSPEGVEIAADVAPKRMDPREKLSMAKLLAAIAIDAYGYDPDAKRGPIPKELANIADRLGLEITEDTIRNYLRLGADQLPKGWKTYE